MSELGDLLSSMLPERVAVLPLLPGVVELIEAAEVAGWKLGLATGHDPERLRVSLERFGVLHRFDAIVTAAEVSRGKPAPDIFLEVARRLDTNPEGCVVLEDSRPGCEAATAAGMTVVLCPSLVSAHLEFPPHVRRVTTLSEVSLTDFRAENYERTAAAGSAAKSWAHPDEQK